MYQGFDEATFYAKMTRLILSFAVGFSRIIRLLPAIIFIYRLYIVPARAIRSVLELHQDIWRLPVHEFNSFNASDRTVRYYPHLTSAL